MSQIAKSLREIADLIEANPEMVRNVSIFSWISDDTPEGVVAVEGIAKSKAFVDGGCVRVKMDFPEVDFAMSALAMNVCEKKVVTKTVEEYVLRGVA